MTTPQLTDEEIRRRLRELSGPQGGPPSAEPAGGPMPSGNVAPPDDEIRRRLVEPVGAAGPPGDEAIRQRLSESPAPLRRKYGDFRDDPVRRKLAAEGEPSLFSPLLTRKPGAPPEPLWSELPREILTDPSTFLGVGVFKGAARGFKGLVGLGRAAPKVAEEAGSVVRRAAEATVSAARKELKETVPGGMLARERRAALDAAIARRDALLQPTERASRVSENVVSHPPLRPPPLLSSISREARLPQELSSHVSLIEGGPRTPYLGAGGKFPGLDKNVAAAGAPPSAPLAAGLPPAVPPAASFGDMSALDKLGELANVARLPLTAADHSTILRNAGSATLAHPEQAKAAFVNSLKSIKSEAQAIALDQELRQAPNFAEIARSTPELFVGLHGTEEAFYGGSILRKVPVAGKVIGASERAFTSYNNHIRYGIVNDRITKWEAVGIHPAREALDSQAAALGFKDSAALRAQRTALQQAGKWTSEMGAVYKADAARFKDIADYGKFVQHTTGRGGLGPLRDANRLLSAMLFAPRWLVAQPQMLMDALNPTTSWNVRQLVLRDLGIWLGAGTATLGLAAMAGARVERDPRSSDFGKIQIGNTRINVWGSLATSARYASQYFTAQAKSGDAGILREQQRGETALKFARAKLAPLPSAIWDVSPMTKWQLPDKQGVKEREPASDFLGRPIKGTPGGVAKEVYRRTTPLFLQDAASLAKEKRPELLPLTIPSFFGVGLQTYEADAQKLWRESGGKGKLSSQPERVRKLYAKEARRLQRIERSGRD